MSVSKDLQGFNAQRTENRKSPTRPTGDLKTVAQENQRKDASRWNILLCIAGLFVACTILAATAAQLGLFSSVFSDYISGDTGMWIEHRRMVADYIDLNSNLFNLNHFYFQQVDDLSPLMIPVTNLLATILAILIVGACGMSLSRKTGIIAASLIALNPFFWLVALGPAKEPMMLGITAASLALIMRVKLPAILWIGAVLVVITGLFLRLEFTVAVVLGTASVLTMRRLGLDRFVSLEWVRLPTILFVVSMVVLAITIIYTAPRLGFIYAGIRWAAVNVVLLVLWVTVRREPRYRGTVINWSRESTRTQLSVKILLLVAVTGAVILPMLMTSQSIPLPNGRSGFNTSLYYDHFESINTSKGGALSLEITRALAGSPWTGSLNVLYRLAASASHAPLRPIFFTEDGRIPLYLLFQWLSEFMVTLGLPATVLILLTRKPTEEYGKTIAALACGMCVLLGCFPAIQVRYFIPLMPFFIILLALLGRRERQALVIITVLMAVAGPIGLYLLGVPPLEVTAQELAPGENPFLPSWLAHERPAG